MTSLHALLRPALQTSRKRLNSTQLRRFASEANIDFSRSRDDSAFIDELFSSQPRPRPTSVSASRRETQSVLDGLKDLLEDHRSQDQPSQNDLLNAVLDLDQHPSQRKLVEKAIKRHTFEALDSELDQIQEHLANMVDDHQLWTFAQSKITRASSDAVASEAYPQIALLLFDRLPTYLQLPFFQLVSSTSAESFVYGCTPQLFSRVLQLQWRQFGDVQAMHDTVLSMLNAGIPLNIVIRDLVRDVAIALEADSQKATDEAIEALTRSPPPPSSNADAMDLETAQIRTEALKRQRFGQAEHDALESMQALLAAEPISELLEEEANSSSFKTLSSSRSEAAPAQPDHPQGQQQQHTLNAFDDWIKQTEAMAPDSHSKSAGYFGQTHNSSHNSSVYLHHHRRS